MVVAVAGNVDHAKVVRDVRRAFGRKGFLDGEGIPVAPATDQGQTPSPGGPHTPRPFEQVNIVLGMKGLTRADERSFALGVLNTALGGGTSSRLFQEVRERRGLAYSVYSFASHHADAGLVGVSVGCLPGKLDDVLATVRAELAKVAADGITAEELDRGKGQLRGGLVLGLEDSGSRMSRLGKAELVYDGLLLPRRGGRADRRRHPRRGPRVAAELFARPEVLAIVGPVREIGPSRTPWRDRQSTRRPMMPMTAGRLLLHDRDPEATRRGPRRPASRCWGPAPAGWPRRTGRPHRRGRRARGAGPPRPRTRAPRTG